MVIVRKAIITIYSVSLSWKMKNSKAVNLVGLRPSTFLRLLVFLYCGQILELVDEIVPQMLFRVILFLISLTDYDYISETSKQRRISLRSFTIPVMKCLAMLVVLTKMSISCLPSFLGSFNFTLRVTIGTLCRTTSGMRETCSH